MISNDIICTICLEPINTINPNDNYHSIKYTSPILDNNLIDSPINIYQKDTLDISSTESGESEICSPSIQHSYIEAPELQSIIEKQIQTTIENYESRVDNLEVNVDPRPDQNEYEVVVIFDIVGQDFPAQEFSFILKATR